MPIPKKTGPVALTNTTTTNIMQGGGGTAGLRDRIKHMHVANKTASVVTFDLYLGGANGNVAGTELFKGHSIDPNAEFDWYGDLPLEATEYLVGGASAAASLTITIEFEREAA